MEYITSNNIYTTKSHDSY